MTDIYISYGRRIASRFSGTGMRLSCCRKTKKMHTAVCTGDDTHALTADADIKHAQA